MNAKNFYTTVLKKSGVYWVTLCLENGLVGQGVSKEEAIQKLKEAIESFEEYREKEIDVYKVSVSIGELHEFLTVKMWNCFGTL